MMELEKEDVEITSVAIFLTHYLSELLKQIDSKPDKEKIIRRLLD